jgi:hypothetical protein
LVGLCCASRESRWRVTTFNVAAFCWMFLVILRLRR